MRYALILILCPVLAHASSFNAFDPVVPVIFWLIILCGLGIFGRFVAAQLHLPGVMGEMVAGILFGNIGYLLGVPLIILFREGSSVFAIIKGVLSGYTLPNAIQAQKINPHYAEQILNVLQNTKDDNLMQVVYAIDILGRFGIIFLLFMVGLECSLKELRQTGRESVQVAILGVIFPVILSLISTLIFFPTIPFPVQLFMAGTLSATSIAVSSRILKDLKKLRTREARTILGAAVVDDVLGLLLLAFIGNIAIHQHELQLKLLGSLFIWTFVFFISVFVLWPIVMKLIFRFIYLLDPLDAKVSIVFLLLMGLVWFASVMQLAPIIGAFTAGVLINEYSQREQFEVLTSFNVKELIAPLWTLLAPLFFILIGMQVKLDMFNNAHIIFLSMALTIAAIIGKLLSGLGANKKDDRLAVGIGMLPRGEVGLIFAAVGKTLGVLNDELFSALIITVMLTTLIGIPLLKFRIAKHDS